MENKVADLPAGWQKENTQIIALFFISAFFVYFMPSSISGIYFILVLIFAFRSKNPYFWIAFILLLLAQPAGFFSGGLRADVHRLPLYSFGKGASFSVFDLFLMGYAIKAITKPVKKIFYRSGLILLTFYAIILFIYSLTLGISFSSFIHLSRWFIFPYAFFLLVPRLISTRLEFENMIKLLLPFVILAFIGQIHEIYFGKFITTYFKEGADTISEKGLAMVDKQEGVSRAFDSEILVLLSFFMSGFYLLLRAKNFNRIWIVVVLYLDFIICFSSATRGIFLTFSAITLTLFYFLFKSSLLKAKDFTSLFLVVLVIIIGFNLLKQNDVLSVQLSRATERFSSLNKYIGKENFNTPEVEDARADERIPKLMKHIKDSPVIGYGFSDKAMEYADGHVGFHNQAIEGGILELIVFLVFFISLVSKVRKISTGFMFTNQKKALRFLVYTLLALLIVHGTSSQYYGYLLGFESSRRWYLLALVFCGMNLYYEELADEIRKAKSNFLKSRKASFPVKPYVGKYAAMDSSSTKKP